MTESEAQKILLVRAFEDPLTAPWTGSDQAWASDEASRSMGENAGFESWLVTRSELATNRLSQRLPSIAQTLASLKGSGWLMFLPWLAFLVGLATDALGSTQRVNILAPPLFALIVWNLLVYAILATAAIKRSFFRITTLPTAGPIGSFFENFGRNTLDRLARGYAKQEARPAIARFLGAWARQSEAIQTLRLAKILHQASMALAAGLLISLYVRGIAFEYRAGWDSTFLSPQSLHTFLTWLLSPAAQLTGQALPSVQELTALRFSVGSGENAARWIHFYAITTAALVLVPRAMLAIVAGARVRRMRQDFTLPLDETYFRRMRPSPASQGTVVKVLPYSYHLPTNALTGLQAILTHGLGSGIDLTVSEPIPLGGEDNLDQWLPTKLANATSTNIAVVFSLMATPERENQGALISALANLSNHTKLGLVLIDESGFRQRFVGSDGETRRQQRRKSWLQLMHEYDIKPLFVDLVSPDLDVIASELQSIPLLHP